jgi:hypothetical protein
MFVYQFDYPAAASRNTSQRVVRDDYGQACLFHQ